jgi:hypothetical protein
MAITLGGCSLINTSQPDESITPMQPMQADESIKPIPSPIPSPVQFISEKVAVFSFQDKVYEYWPLFTFAVAESEIANAELMPYQYTIDITCDEFEDYAPQTIEVASGVRWTSENRETCISLVDVDFDGNHKDIQVVIFSGLGNLTYSFYRWNSFVGKGDTASLKQSRSLACSRRNMSYTLTPSS